MKNKRYRKPLLALMIAIAMVIAPLGTICTVDASDIQDVEESVAAVPEEEIIVKQPVEQTEEAGAEEIFAEENADPVEEVGVNELQEDAPAVIAKNHSGETQYNNQDSLSTGQYYLLNDTAARTKHLQINADSDVTICLCGKTLDLGAYMILLNPGASLTINDCSSDGSGKIVSSKGSDGYVICTYSSNNNNPTRFTLNAGTIEATGGASGFGFVAEYKTIVTINGGKINAKQGVGIKTAAGTDGSQLYINGGEITANTYGVFCEKASVITNISGGTISGGTYGLNVANNAGAIQLSGGTYHGGTYAINSGGITLDKMLAFTEDYESKYYSSVEQQDPIDVTNKKNTTGYKDVIVKQTPIEQGVQVFSGTRYENTVSTETTVFESQYPTNLVNGSFEEKAYYLDESYTRMYASANADTIAGWMTTATDKKIEVGWLSNRQNSGGNSQHMATVSETLNEKGGADGAQFIETVGKTAGSPYQEFAISAGETITWQFSHRGRATGDDTVAMFIGEAPDNLADLDKSNADKNDIFYQIVSWLKTTKGVTAPSNNQAVTYTVYTTKVDGATKQLSVQETLDPFSAEKDDVHTQRWQVTLFSSNVAKWNTARGSYTADSGQTKAIIAFAPFWSSFTSAVIPEPGVTTAGNLLDAIHVWDTGGTELISNSSFEAVTLNTKYSNEKAANSSNSSNLVKPWRTTASDRIIEVGIYNDKYNVYNLLPSYSYTEYPYIRDGCQFVELNATQESSLYQYVSTKASTKYNWSLSHRGRTGIDTMALIIGPKQQYDPKKKSSNDRDQLMQIVDWMKQQTDVVIEGDSEDNCSQKFIIYSSGFDNNGGYTTENPFSWTEDDDHTELWNIWIISSTNDKWYDYGAADSNAEYNYSYYVPGDVDTSIFAFVSYSSAPRKDTGLVDMTYGNILDNVQFDLYYSVIGNTTPNGTGSIAGSDYIENITDAEEKDFDSENEYSGWALSETAFRVVAKEENRTFLGAIINGRFVPADKWTKNDETNEYYYDVKNVGENYDIRLIFAAEKVVYDVNGGDPYHWNTADQTTGHEVKLDAVTNPSYVSHAATSSKDGWRFNGWQHTAVDSTQNIFEGVHTVSFVQGESIETDTMQIAGVILGTEENRTVSGIPATEGVTMVAQWLYRQRFATQVIDKETQTYKFSSDVGTIDTNLHTADIAKEPFKVEGVSEKVGTDYYIVIIKFKIHP